MQTFAECVANQANNIQLILISDLHLSPNEPVLTQAFLHFLNQVNQLPDLQQLYILGDWFDAWLGDDVADTNVLKDWLQPIIHQLQQLQKKGCQINVMHGNRDFLIGEKFCEKFDGKLLSQPYFFQFQYQNIRLEHGDLLCSDDKQYQRFRKIIQNPITKKILLSLPIKKRQQIAQNLRQKSKTDNQKKSLQIMDINQQTVNKTLTNIDILIHGHTHRPQQHHENQQKQRLVLGDWRKKNDNVEAVIIIGGKKMELCLFIFDDKNAQ